MKKLAKTNRLIVPHSKDCFYNGRKDCWSGIVDSYYWGNFAAHKVRHGGHYIWYKVTCNDPKCKGMKAVHSSLLCDPVD